MAALCSLNLHLFGNQQRILNNLKKSHVSCFINLQILLSKENDVFRNFEKTFKRVVILLSRTARSQNFEHETVDFQKNLVNLS